MLNTIRVKITTPGVTMTGEMTLGITTPAVTMTGEVTLGASTFRLFPKRTQVGCWFLFSVPSCFSPHDNFPVRKRSKNRATEALRIIGFTFPFGEREYGPRRA